MPERYKLFSQDGNNLKHANKYCPKCGEGVFMADHSDRRSCGKCGYTEFKKK